MAQKKNLNFLDSCRNVMVFCHKCGNELPDDAQYCNKCGVTLLVSNSKTEEKSTRIKEERSFKKILYPIIPYLTAIIFGIIAGILVYLFERKDNPTLAKRGLILGIIMTPIYFFIALSYQ